ncbi:MAG: hypothetical protein M0Z76_09930 [Gammaproteobacteria bacterium]|nr:hypothetical protein [Gammaproteobacteria bacterium]
MSLINKMLKDLEARDRQTPASPQTILAGLRPAPAQRTRPWLVMVLGILIAAAAVFWWHARTPRPMAASVSPRLVPAPPPALARGALSQVPVPATVVAPAKPAAAPHPARPPMTPVPRRLRAHPTARPQAVTAPLAPVRTARTSSPSKSPVWRAPVVLTPAEQARTLYHEAVRRLEGGHRRVAQALLRRALAADAALMPPRLLLAGLAMQERHYGQARAWLTQGLILHPHALPAAMLLAQVDLHFEQPGAAVALLKPFASSPSANEPFIALYAGAAMRAGQTNLAAAIYRMGVVRYPHSGVLWTGLGICDVARRQPAAAKRAFAAALRCPLSPVLLRFVKEQRAQLP